MLTVSTYVKIELRVKAMAKTTYHHGDLRQALIEGAIALITEQDVSSLSLREVARRVGVSHAAPYRHFEDKEALLAAVAEAGFRGLTQTLTDKIQPLQHPLRRLEASGVAYVEYARSHPSHYQVMFGTPRSERDKYPAKAAAAQQAFMVLANIIIEGQAAGVIKPGEPQQLAQVAWSLVHGLAMLLINGQLSVLNVNVEALASFVTRTLVEGLACASQLSERKYNPNNLS